MKSLVALGLATLTITGIVGLFLAGPALADPGECIDEVMADACAADPVEPWTVTDEETGLVEWSGTAAEACQLMNENFALLQDMLCGAPGQGQHGPYKCPRKSSGACAQNGQSCTAPGNKAGRCETKLAGGPRHYFTRCPCKEIPPPSSGFGLAWLSAATLLAGLAFMLGGRSHRA